MALRFDTYDIPFVGKLDQRTNPRILPPGNFVQLYNVEFYRTGELGKRPGVNLTCSSADGLHVDRFFRWRDQIGVVDGQGSDSVAAQMYLRIPGTADYSPQFTVPAPTIERRPLFHDLSQDIIADVACAGGYTVHVIMCVTDGNVILRVMRDSDGDTVSETILGTVSGNQKSVRAAASGDYVLVTWSGGAANNIRAVWVRCDLNPPTISSLATLATDEETGGACLHDLCGRNTTSPTWVLAYRTSTATLKAALVDNTPATTASVTIGSTETPLALSVENNQTAGGGTTFVNWFANVGGSSAWRYAALNSSFAVAVGSPWDWFASTVVSPRISTVSIRDDGSALLFNSEWAGSADQVPITSWATGTGGGVVGSVQRKRRPWIISDAWRENARHYVWVKDLTRATPVSSAILLEVDGEQDEDTTLAYVAATELPGAQGNHVTEILPSSVSSDGTRMRTAIAGRYVPTENRIGAYEMSARFDHKGRYQNVMFGGSCYMAGGAILQYDGVRAFENGFPQAPVLDGQAVGGSAAWGSTGTVTYVALYESVDAGAERHRSFLGPPLQVEIATATDEVELFFEHCTLSRRFWGPNAVIEDPRVVVTIYRSISPNSDVLHRIFRFESTPAACINDPTILTNGTLTDTGQNITANEPLYTLGGNLENSMAIGGATSLVVHGERLWAAGGSELDVIRISKQFVTGEPAQFALGLELRIPGEEIVGMESLNTTLVAFGKRRIYKIVGDGPNDTGDPSTGWWTVATIDTDVGCSDPRSIVNFPGGIIFRSDRGFYMLGLDMVPEFIGADADILGRTYTDIRSAEVVANKQQVRFYCARPEESRAQTGDTVAIVFDYFEKKWLQWVYTHVGTVADSIYVNGQHHHVTETANWYSEPEDPEDPVYWDAQNWYGARVKTGNNIFSSLHGQKKLGRFMLQGSLVGEHNLLVRFWKDDSLTQEWKLKYANLGASQLYQQRYKPRYGLGQSYAFEIIEEQYSGLEVVVDSAGFRLTGMSASVARVGGLRRMPTYASR